MNDLITTILVPAVVSLIVIGAGAWSNRKLGIGSGQRTLVTTLQGEVAALKARDERREREFDACKERLEHVEQSNDDLRGEVFQLRTQLTTLVLKASRPRTRRTRTDD